MIVATSNTGDGSGALINGITALLYGQTAEQPRPSATRPIRATLAAGGLEAAETAFRAARAGDDHTVSEDDLNGLGYEALARGEAGTAVALFRLNAEALRSRGTSTTAWVRGWPPPDAGTRRSPPTCGPWR